MKILRYFLPATLGLLIATNAGSQDQNAKDKREEHLEEITKNNKI